MNTGIYLVTASRKVLFHEFGNKTHDICKTKGSRLMGLAKKDEDIYFANHSEIFKYNEELEKIHQAKNNMYYHHMKIYDNFIFILATKFNEIVIFNMITKEYKGIKIKPGNHHLSSIFLRPPFTFITLNKSAIRHNRRYSSVCVLDGNFNLIDEFEYGWQSHGFCIIKGNKYGLCNYWSGQGNMEHPHYSGLMVNGEIEFRFKDDEFFKDISADDEYLYISGCKAVPRKHREYESGILYILDYNMNVKDRITFKDSGEINGCLLNNHDLTN